MRKLSVGIFVALTIPLFGSLIPNRAHAMPPGTIVGATIKETGLANQLVHYRRYRRYAYYPPYVYQPYWGRPHWVHHGHFGGFHGGFVHGGFGHGGFGHGGFGGHGGHHE